MTLQKHFTGFCWRRNQINRGVYRLE